MVVPPPGAPPAGPSGGGGAGGDAMAQMVALMARMVAVEESRAGAPRPKAINCRMYKLGQSWPDFAIHFYQCIKAAYHYDDTVDDERDRLRAACCSWLPSKLEPGPTLIAYEALKAATKEELDGEHTNERM